MLQSPSLSWTHFSQAPPKMFSSRSEATLPFKSVSSQSSSYLTHHQLLTLSSQKHFLHSACQTGNPRFKAHSTSQSLKQLSDFHTSLHLSCHSASRAGSSSPYLPWGILIHLEYLRDLLLPHSFTFLVSVRKGWIMLRLQTTSKSQRLHVEANT